MKAETVRKPRKFCGACRWFEETQPFIGQCSKYKIMTRMENYKFACREWAPIPGPAGADGLPVTG